MKKSYMLALLIVLFASNAMALVLAWDTYTDPLATSIRVESSIDQQNWSTLIDDIAKTATSVVIPDHNVDYQRVYYRLKGFNATDVSGPSNVVSFYWTTGGSGTEGVGSPSGVKFIDCSNPQSPVEQQICTDLGL